MSGFLRVYYEDLEKIAKEGKCPCSSCEMGYESQTMNTDGEIISHSCRDQCEYYELYEDVRDGEKTKKMNFQEALDYSIYRFKRVWQELARR